MGPTFLLSETRGASTVTGLRKLFLNRALSVTVAEKHKILLMAEIELRTYELDVYWGSFSSSQLKKKLKLLMLRYLFFSLLWSRWGAKTIHLFTIEQTKIWHTSWASSVTEISVSASVWKTGPELHTSFGILGFFVDFRESHAVCSRDHVVPGIKSRILGPEQ